MTFEQLQKQNDCKKFQQHKDQCLSGVDLSRKGSVDAPIVDVVKFINMHADCFTTSSCSGRVIVVDNTDEHGEVQKQGCHWLYVTHEEACLDSVKASLQDVKGAAVFKFEPMVMHIQVRTLEWAQRLAVRSTHCLEVPLSSNGQLLVSDMYLEHLVQCANKKMQENINRIARFFSNLKSMAEDPQETVTQRKRSKDKRQQTPPKDPSTVRQPASLVSTDLNHDRTVKDVDNVEEYFDCLLFEDTS